MGNETRKLRCISSLMHQMQAQHVAQVVSDAAEEIDRLREAMRWIPISEQRPEDGQQVEFVVSTTKESAFSYLDGIVLGGRYVSGMGFSVPGLALNASYWKPSTPPPGVLLKPMPAGRECVEGEDPA